jgi:hypothetical protein
VPRHVARLVGDYFASRRLVGDYFASRRLVGDYFASRRLVVDYFAHAACPGTSAHRAARCVARRRLLRLRRTSGCLGTSRGSSSTTSLTLCIRLPRLVVGYFALRGSSSTTSPTPCLRVPRLLARLVVDLTPSLPLDFS